MSDQDRGDLLAAEADADKGGDVGGVPESAPKVVAAVGDSVPLAAVAQVPSPEVPLVEKQDDPPKEEPKVVLAESRKLTPEEELLKKMETIKPRCPYCGQDPAIVAARLIEIPVPAGQPVPVIQAFYCGNDMCRKIFNVMVAGFKAPPVVSAPSGLDVSGKMPPIPMDKRRR
jgi:hypothetical protein